MRTTETSATRWGGSLALVAALGVALSPSCRSPAPPATAPGHEVAVNTSAASPPTPSSVASSTRSESADVPHTTPPPRIVQVALLAPPTLRVIEKSGFALGTLVAGRDAATTAELGHTTAFRSIFDVLRGDVRAATRTHRLARVTSIDGFRLFDERWFDSEEMSFALTGVFNRLDRQAFYQGTCGEIRFVYRLAYETKQGGEPMRSRLPMTVNVVYLVTADGNDGDCRAVARAWRSPEGLDEKGLAHWALERGPLRSEMKARWVLKAVETNHQTVRLQSSVHPSLAGHIEYVLRVFHRTAAAADGDEDNSFEPAPLENMPDVARLSRDGEARQALLDYLKQPNVLQQIDRGTLRLPDSFVDRSAVSVAPRGLSRRQNRPFRQLFDPSDFDDVATPEGTTVASGEAILRRLDQTSCVGCHQTRTMAGFHHLGAPDASEATYNSLLSGMSPHLTSDLERRRSYVSAVAAGATPDEFRPLPERQGVGRGHGAPCGLGDSGFADWTCDDGYTCVELEDDEVGACFAEGEIGSPCEYGTMLPHERPHRDFVTNLQRHTCGNSQICDLNVQGFPLGSCGASCSTEAPSSTCGDFLDVDGYQNCLRARRPHSECEQQFVFRTGLRSCDDEHPCRQDFVCVRTRDEGRGACIPPYFVYQLRLDGYPLKH